MTGRIYGRPATGPAATGATAAFAAVFLACLQWWTFHETLQPGRQYPDPLLPCLALAVLLTPLLTLAALVPLRLYHGMRARSLDRSLSAVRTRQDSGPASWLPRPPHNPPHNPPRHPPQTSQTSQTLPMLIAEHPDAPARIVWKPDGGVFEPGDIGHIARLAFDHDVLAIVVSMRPAAEQAARILLEQAWQRLCLRHRVRRPCPVVLPVSTGTTRPLPRMPRAVPRSSATALSPTTLITMPVKGPPAPPGTPA